MSARSARGQQKRRVALGAAARVRVQRKQGSGRAANEPSAEVEPPSELRVLRRTQILAAAQALVSAEGLDALTFGALEGKLGFSRGVITYHFADKDELVVALLRAAVDEIDGGTQVALRGSSTLEEKVRAVLASKARGFIERQDAARVLISFWGRAGRDARARAVHAELFARYRAEAATLARWAKKEMPGSDVHPEALAALLVGAIIGLAVQAILQPDSFPLDLALEEAARAFSARLRGA